MLNKLKLLSFIFVYVSQIGSIFSQKNDFNWLCGYAGGKGDPKFGVTVLDFHKGNMELRFDPKITMYLLNTNSVISDFDGNLMLYSNGDLLYNSEDQSISGAEDLNKVVSDRGNGLDYASLLLNKPGTLQEYLLFYPFDTVYRIDSFSGGVSTLGLQYATVMIDINDRQGKLIERDRYIHRDTTQGHGYSACRHANGRDWWILEAEKPPSKGIYKILIDPNGPHIVDKQQFPNYITSGVSQTCFSPDGNYYLHYSLFSYKVGGFLNLFKFDRCSGYLERIFEYHFDQLSIYGGACFSPDSKKIYYCNSSALYQINLINPDPWESKILIDSINLVPRGGMSYSFFNNAPDGKIYIGTGYTQPFLHVIHKPNLIGTACEVVRSGISLQNFNASTPNFPHFRLGPIDGSSCDTLGIDNIPWCWWRYNQDTSNHLCFEFTDLSAYEVAEWYWDYSDGTQSRDTSPIHCFPKNGVYEVCLIVKNINGADTLCRTLNIGTTGIKEVNLGEIKIDLFPNPVHDNLIINLIDYIPERMDVQLINLQGSMILKQRIFQGSNVMNVEELVEGVYLLNVFEQGLLIKSEKLIKY
ncbi:MAG: PKD domain-containing protein [Saprospiraceae bacterium]